MRTASVGLQLLGPSLVTLLFLLSWRLLLGLPLLFLRLSVYRMSNSHLMVLVWVLWWQLVMLSSWLRFYMVLGFGFYVTLFSWEWCSVGGRVLLFAAYSASCLFFVEGVPSMAFDAQCSPGPANSL